ncbi:MAG: BamA/TamA family outer membrane protein [Opitutaceae bacterium]
MRDVSLVLLALVLGSPTAMAQEVAKETAEPLGSSLMDDGWLDLSGFLDKKFGFLPLAVPITEPAVGYGIGGGVAFLDKPFGEARKEFSRPNATFAGGFASENDSWGLIVGDMRQWEDGRLQTLAGTVHASVNLDFYGIGSDDTLGEEPRSYNLEPTGGMVQGKYRLGESRVFAGFGYALASIAVSFDSPGGAPGLPGDSGTSNVGGLSPSLTYDTRDNIFTPIKGTYLEASLGLFTEWLGSDGDFRRSNLIAMHYLPLRDKWTLGLRGQITTSSEETPFYLRPFVYLRGVPAMRYQGEDMAQLEAELCWQFWERYSLVGFAGTGAAWNEWTKFERRQSVVAGGGGFRYEIAREYGIHAGLDVAFGPENTAIYI